jgi:hypothetical protein
MRVAYQAGVIRALYESGLTFAHADGTSGGTINLSMMLSGLTPDEMCDRWRTLNVTDFASLMPLEEYLKGPNEMAMGDADGIIKKVFPHLGIDVQKIRASQGIDGTFNVCNFSRKQNEVISHRDVSLDLLVAGISLPIFMPPVKIDNSFYTDSVWIKDANLIGAVKKGAQEIWLVWCIGNTSEYKSGIFNQYVHMIEMSANGVLLEEFDRIEEVNARIRRGDSPYGQTEPVRLHVIKPDYPLPLDPDLYLGKIDTTTLIDMGYADATRYLQSARLEGIPFTPEATMMNEPSVGFTFREMMAGPFAFGETDPRIGEQKGAAAGTSLAIHATISIGDLKRFIADPNHRGDMSGQLDVPTFGNSIPATKGVFNLFSPTDNPKMKYMVYEFGFTQKGEQYYFAGRKEVRNDPLIDLWKETTTLYSTLHKGTDKSGQIIGAGVLKLSVGELIKMVPTMQPTNAKSAEEKAAAIMQFGKFFLGEVWEQYGPKL